MAGTLDDCHATKPWWRIDLRGSSGGVDVMDLSTIAGEFGSLPDAFKVALGYSLKPMLGDLKAIPAFLGRHGLRGIEAGTVARIEAGKELGKLVAAKAVEDDSFVEAAKEVLLPGEILRAQNRIGVAAAAINEAAGRQREDPDAKFESARAPDDDWLMAFMRHAEDASSDELRTLFGRILAGQICQPKSFSRTTLRTVSELDEQTAADFIWYWHQAIDDGYAPESIVPGPGSEWSRLNRLRDAGLVSSVLSSVWQPQIDGVPSLGHGWVIGFARFKLIFFYKDIQNREIRNYPLTKVGQELSAIVEPPPFRENLTSFARRYIADDGIVRISLLADGKEEIIIDKRDQTSGSSFSREMNP
jgi:hypothetical protein